MRKNVIRIGAAVGVAAGLAVAGSAIASAQDADADLGPFPSVTEQQQIFIEGGENAGKGAAQLVSGAYLGVPASVLDFAQEVGNYASGAAPVK